MSRTLSVTMAAHVAGPVLTLTNCLKITRLDGTVFGFTSLDVDIVIDGVTYEAASSVDASEIRQSVGGGVDNLTLLGLITSNRITDTDLRAGRWDGAKVELFHANFENIQAGRILLLTGTLGEITQDQGQYHAEVRSLSQRLAQQVGELTSPLCRVRQLFDLRCMPKGVNENGVGGQDGTLTPASFRFTRTVSQVDSATVIRFSSEPAASAYYAHGRVHFNTGLNVALEREVKTHVITAPSVAIITLQETFPFAVQVGDTALLEAGCDRTPSQCAAKFLNIYNLQSEPHLIGNDQLIKRGKR